jgi:uncharacterized secreted protein with C-terminal beta-propeller domain
MAGEEDGTITGLAVNLFDVSDFANPALAYQYVIDAEDNQWSWSEAMWDHHAFTFHRDVLSFPVYISNGWIQFSGLIVLGVDVDSGFDELGRVDHGDMLGDDWYPTMRRSVYIEENLYSLSSRGIKVNRLLEPHVLLATIPFHPFGPVP